MMYQFREKRGKATPELAADFGKPSLDVLIRIDEEGCLGNLEQSDLPLHWYLLDADDRNIYMGAATIRNNKVHYYDRYPMGGGPYLIKDFTDPTFRKRCELIAANIERILLEE